MINAIDPSMLQPVGDSAEKPQYIKEQHNHGCQQFYGPVVGCVFAMPGANVYQTPDVSQPGTASATKPEKQATPKQSGTTRKARPAKPKVPTPEKEHGKARDTFACDKRITHHHLDLLMQEMVQDGWLSGQTSKTCFRALFSGKASACEIVWSGRVGLGSLKELFTTMQEELLISLPQGARSVNSVLENHVVDTEGHYISGLHGSEVAASSYQTIAKYIEILKVKVDVDDIEKMFADLEVDDPSYR